MNSHPQHNDPHDRLIDQALHETLGGAGPPDLSAKILAAARAAGALNPTCLNPTRLNLGAMR